MEVITVPHPSLSSALKPAMIRTSKLIHILHMLNFPPWSCHKHSVSLLLLYCIASTGSRYKFWVSSVQSESTDKLRKNCLSFVILLAICVRRNRVHARARVCAHVLEHAHACVRERGHVLGSVRTHLWECVWQSTWEWQKAASFLPNGVHLLWLWLRWSINYCLTCIFTVVPVETFFPVISCSLNAYSSVPIAGWPY